VNAKAVIFQRFADEIAGAAHARAAELLLEWDRNLRFAVDCLMQERCAVAALGANELSDDQVEATQRFLELELELTQASVREAANAEEIGDAVMCGSDGMHSFLLAHDLIDRYLDWNDAASEWLDVLTYGHDAWQTLRGIEAREKWARERAGRRQASAA
jgi:hypothetical protein